MQERSRKVMSYRSRKRLKSIPDATQLLWCPCSGEKYISDGDWGGDETRSEQWRMTDGVYGWVAQQKVK